MCSIPYENLIIKTQQSTTQNGINNKSGNIITENAFRTLLLLSFCALNIFSHYFGEYMYITKIHTMLLYVCTSLYVHNYHIMYTKISPISYQIIGDTKKKQSEFPHLLHQFSSNSNKNVFCHTLCNPCFSLMFRQNNYTWSRNNKGRLTHFNMYICDIAYVATLLHII